MIELGQGTQGAARGVCFIDQDPRGGQRGICLVELLLALALGLCVALAALPVWSRVEGAALVAAENSIWGLQARVAVARLERDLRLATTVGAPFARDTPLLQAASTQVVLLTRDVGSDRLVLVEWELSGDNLMRRWGDCPQVEPTAFPHSLYRDSKTMLERVAAGRSGFRFVTVVGEVVNSWEPQDLGLVEWVGLTLGEAGSAHDVPGFLETQARLGR